VKSDRFPPLSATTKSDREPSFLVRAHLPPCSLNHCGPGESASREIADDATAHPADSLGPLPTPTFATALKTTTASRHDSRSLIEGVR